MMCFKAVDVNKSSIQKKGITRRLTQAHKVCHFLPRYDLTSVISGDELPLLPRGIQDDECNSSHRVEISSHFQYR